MTTTPQFADVHNAFRKWAGEPYSVSTFRHDSQSVGDFNSLDVLCYRSESEDSLRPEDEFTFLATVGMSCQRVQILPFQSELVWRITGRRSWEEIQALSEALATVAVLPLYRERVLFVPGKVVRDVTLPVFEKMNSLLVTHWGIHGPEYLPMAGKAVLLLWLKPLYDAEALLAERIGESELSRRFRCEGIDWDNPNRVILGPVAQLGDGGVPNEF